MAATAFDVLFSQRNGANTKFSEIIITENPDGFLGFSPGNALGIYLVTNNDIENSTIALGKLVNVSTNTLLGRITAGTGSPESLSADSTITILNTASSSKFNLARLANIANNRVLGNNSGSSASPTELTPNQMVTLINTATNSFNDTVRGLTISPFTALYRNVALGTVTTTQTINVTSTNTPLRLLVTATLSSANVTFNFTNLTGLAGIEIILVITNGGTSRNVTIHNAGAVTNTKSGIDGYSTTANIPSGATGFSIFGMIFDGTNLHVNNLKYV